MNENSKTSINKGKIIFFGLDHFLKDIAKGNCCFICGADPKKKEFNDEHIIPNWILKEFNLHSKYITLPNSKRVRYKNYKIPCCKDCNSELGRIYEGPISNLLRKSHKEIIEEIKNNPFTMELLFKWITLIYLNTHLKDKFLLENCDTRSKKDFIGDRYDRDDIHHIHCIARSHYTGAKIDKDVYGTIIILQIANCGETFDYIDNSSGQVVMIRIKEFCMISVLNDSSSCLSIIQDEILKITGHLTIFQVREIISHLVYTNINLRERPTFKSHIKTNGDYQIIAKVPKVASLLDLEDRINTPEFVLEYYLKDFIGDGG